MKLCVAIPALNEEATIGDVISRIPRNMPEISDVVVIVGHEFRDDWIGGQHLSGFKALQTQTLPGDGPGLRAEGGP